MGDSIRVLHVDDDPQLGDLVKSFLQTEADRIRVETTVGPAAAFDRLAEQEFDCIVSDYKMPHKNGLEFLAEVRERHGDIPFILFTGEGSEKVASEALTKGATDYLQKQSGTNQYELLANRIHNAVERDRSAKRAANLERIRTLAGDINQALVRATSREEIERRVCEIFSRSIPYQVAWIGEVDSETTRIEPRTTAGDTEGLLDGVTITAKESATEHGPELRAVRNNRIAVTQDVAADSALQQRGDTLIEHGCRAAAAVPLEHGETLFGELIVYAGRPNAFDEDETDLLVELGDDIAHALHSRATETELQRTNNEFRTVFDHVPIGIILMDYDGDEFWYRRSNPRMEELSGLSEEEIRNETPRNAFGTDDGKAVEARYRECVEQGKPIEYTSTFEISGDRVVRNGRVIPVSDGDGIEQLVVIVRDITEQRRRKEERKRSRRYRRKLYELTSSELDDTKKLQRLLELGCERLEVENGHLARIDANANRHEIELAGGSDFVQAGTVTELESTYCRATAESDDILTVYNASEEGWTDDPAYEQWGIGCYIGASVEVNDEFYGTLCFVNREPRERRFTQAEQTFVDLMARWVSHVFERQRHERQLREHQKIVNSVPDGIYILDDNFRFTMVNDAMVELTGRSRDELIGADVSLVFGEEAIDLGRQNRQRLQMGQQEYEQLNTEVRTPDGETIPCVVRGRLLSEPDTDESVATTGVVRDVTEKREFRRQLRSKAARLEALFEDSPDMINVLDSAGEIREANSRLCSELGYDEDDLIGTGIWEIDQLIDAEEVAQLLSNFDVGERRRFEGRYERCDGLTVPVEVHLLRLNLGGKDRFLAISRDISERKAQKEKQNRIISRVTDAIVEVDSDWTFTLVSDQAEDLYGINEDELLGRDFWDVFAEARGTRFEDKYRSVMETRDPTSLVEYYSGLDEWFDIQVYPTNDGGVAFYFQEVSERQQRQRRFEAIFNNTFQFTGLLEPDGKLIEANETALSFGGLDREAVVGKPMWETFWFQASEQARETARRAVERARNGELYRDEVRVQGDDREAVIDFSMRPVFDEQGEVTLLIPEGRDITERKRRERELAESEARYRSLAESFPNGAVFLFDETLEYQIVSGNGFSSIETSPDDLVGNTIYEVEPYSEKVINTLESLMEAILDGHTDTTELIYEDHVYKLRAAPIRDDDGEIIAGHYITQDITKQRHRERELQRQNERLESFASVISHDLRNPLNVVAGRIELAREECDSDHLSDAEAALKRAEALIDDVLTLAREGESVNATDTVRIPDVVERCCRIVETGDATVKINTDQTIEADRSRLQQLFENLTRNAIEHGGRDVTVKVGDLDDGFYVEDDGPGIPEEERNRVFESAYSTVEGNTGFGLAIVKEIVEAHGWDINVAESGSGGARFEITYR